MLENSICPTCQKRYHQFGRKLRAGEMEITKCKRCKEIVPIKKERAKRTLSDHLLLLDRQLSAELLR